jgi:hypothetical protein
MEAQIMNLIIYPTQMRLVFITLPFGSWAVKCYTLHVYTLYKDSGQE